MLLTERESFVKQRKEFPDVSQMIHVNEMTEDLSDLRFNISESKGKLLRAIFSFVDPYVSIAAQLMNEFCNSAISVKSFRRMEDKTETRKVLKNNKATPIFEIFHPTEDLNHLIKK